MAPVTAVDVAALLEYWGHDELARALEGSELHTWTEPAEAYREVDHWVAESYPDLFADLIIVPGRFDQVESDLEVIGDAIDEVLGGVRYWRVVEGDEPDEAYEPKPPEFVPAPMTPRPATWKAMKFRSQSEVQIAHALERANVLFWANARGRVGPNADSRETRESDFLVFSDGKFGVLEVDGPTHEGKASQDHERDRLFQHHGLRVVQRFDSNRCYQMPDDVVAEFLQLLHRIG